MIRRRGIPHCGGQERAVVIIDNHSVYFSAVGRVLKALGYPVTCVPFNPALVAILPQQILVNSPSLVLLGDWHCPAAVATILRALAAIPSDSMVLVVDDGTMPTSSPPLRERIAADPSPIACTTAELDDYLQTLTTNNRGQALTRVHTVER